ncbi:MAG: alpha/beta fold hydrolase [Pseudomonadota bacterium]
MGRAMLWLGGIGLLLLAVLLGGVLTRPPRLLPPMDTMALDVAGIDSHLASSEERSAAHYGIVEGAAKQLRWYGEPGTRSEFAVVYLHGFSATRQEIHPVPERVADALGANLFSTRWRGHGREREQMRDTSAEDWLQDGIEALTIGAAIGDKVIVMGTSTGATMAVALARHPLFARIEGLVLTSPNWGLPFANGGTRLATGLYGPLIIRSVMGEEHEWEPANELQGRYWTTRYPSDAVVEMFRLLKLADELTEEARVPNAMLVYSPKDDTVSVPHLLAGFERLPAERKQVVSIEEPRSLSTHVLAGDILGPQETEPMVRRIVDFFGGAES